MIGYGSVLVRCLSISFRLLNLIGQSVIRFIITGFKRKTPIGAPAAQNEGNSGSKNERYRNTPAIAVRYMGGKIGFDVTDRTELFWVRHSIEASDASVVFYNVDRQDTPIKQESLEQLRSEGIRMYGNGKGIETWHPSKQRLRVFASILLQLVSTIFRCLAKGDWVSPYYIQKLVILAWNYSYWFDFYAANRGIMDVCANNRTVGQTLAMDALGGVSIAYQYSISNFYPILGLRAGEDIQFLLSQAFSEPWMLTGYPAGRYVYTGYIYDEAFQSVSKSGRAARIRQKIENRGARFIVCFFDENSIPRWDMPINHPESIADYQYLLEWLLEDPDLGIVFKPKRARNLFLRLSPILDLIEEAKHTGRCFFFMSDTVVGNIYPAEAAITADISVGKLSGGTAAMEAQLVGVPAILIDDEGLLSHPFNRWGKGSVIVHDWTSVRQVVEEFRTNTDSRHTIGNWMMNLDGLDPFRDGKAASRMGLFIAEAYAALKQGKSKNHAILHAQETYRRLWGGDAVYVPGI